MLFVFGYRAQKIRSKKLSVLIHSSDKYKDVQSCTVEVHFQKIIDKVYISLYIYIWVTLMHTTLTLGSPKIINMQSLLDLLTRSIFWWADIFPEFLMYFFNNVH